MAETNTKIGSIRTFLSILDDIKFSKDYIYFYRGHSDYNFKLEPSIYRNDGLTNNENKIFREIILRCPDDFQDNTVTFQKLVKMQHYSLPTRLLDITENSLTALFFACQDSNTDGEVIIFKIHKDDVKYFDSDTVSVLSNVSKLSRSFEISQSKSNNVAEFNKQENIKLLLHEIQQEKHFFSPVINPMHIESVLCVKPKLDNQRIIRQEGAFFLFGIENKKKNCANFPVEKIYYPNSEKLIINASKKENILKQLKRLGINNSSVFPEIDNIAKDIKETYEEVSKKTSINNLNVTNKDERVKRDKISQSIRQAQMQEAKLAEELALKKIAKELGIIIDTNVKNKELNFEFDGIAHSDNGTTIIEVKYMRKRNALSMSAWHNIINRLNTILHDFTSREQGSINLILVVVTDEDIRSLTDYIKKRLKNLSFYLKLVIYDFDTLVHEETSNKYEETNNLP